MAKQIPSQELNTEGNQKQIVNEVADGYKEEIAYLRGLLEKHLIKNI